MALTLMILADGPSADLVAHLGPTAPALYGRLLGDTVQVSRQLPGARVVVRYNPGAHPSILSGLPPGTAAVPAPTGGWASVAAALADGLADGGPALVISGELPHLPLWRLRDAATHLAGDADLVIGPSDRGSWYLLGLRVAAAALLGRVPAPGASFRALAEAAAGGHVTHMLPPWFGISTVADLATLADALRSMPQGVAAGTRALVEAELASRAVGG